MPEERIRIRSAEPLTTVFLAISLLMRMPLKLALTTGVLIDGEGKQHTENLRLRPRIVLGGLSNGEKSNTSSIRFLKITSVNKDA